MTHQIGIKFVEIYIPKGKKKKFIQILIDEMMITEVDAEAFQIWIEHKSKEIKEWIETGKITKWYSVPIKIDKDKLRYVG